MEIDSEYLRVKEITTELRIAAMGGKRDKEVLDLLREGADPNVGKGDTFCSVVMSGDTFMVEYFLAQDADPNTRNGSPLRISVLRGDIAMADLLISYGAKTTPRTRRRLAYHLASIYGHERSKMIFFLVGRETGELFLNLTRTELIEDSDQKTHPGPHWAGTPDGISLPV